jgi:hypothetical protein
MSGRREQEERQLRKEKERGREETRDEKEHERTGKGESQGFHKTESGNSNKCKGFFFLHRIYVLVCSKVSL